ncbi:MAG UNVERIFIED_CONTAM: hypothetical protein LVT10_21055, partial [Anaerolineae bacterium]
FVNILRSVTYCLDVCTWRNASHTARAEQIDPAPEGWRGVRWLFWWWHRAERAPRWGIVGLGRSPCSSSAGHPQTVFIAGLGLTFYALWMGGAWGIVRLGLAGVLALLLTAPQPCPHLATHPTGGARAGLFLMKTLSFSWNPFVIGRAILPSYDSKLFSEYIILLGVSGVILAVVGSRSHVRCPPPPDPGACGRGLGSSGCSLRWARITPICGGSSASGLQSVSCAGAVVGTARLQRVRAGGHGV